MSKLFCLFSVQTPPRNVRLHVRLALPLALFIVFALQTGTFQAAPSHADDAQPIVDHILYGVPHLASGSEDMAARTGLEPSVGGVHPGAGTANSLLSLGGRQYLEIIGPNPDLQTPMGMGVKIAMLEKPGILTFAVASRDLAQVQATAAKLGLKTSGISAGSRRTPAGDLLKWRVLFVSGTGYAGLFPFFIDWQDSPHPGLSSQQGAVLTSLVAAHPKAAALQALYNAFGILVTVEQAVEVSLTAKILSKDQTVTLSGNAQGLN